MKGVCDITRVNGTRFSQRMKNFQCIDDKYQETVHDDRSY